LIHKLLLSFLGQSNCTDTMLLDVCQAYVRLRKCNYREAQMSCRRTCGHCSKLKLLIYCYYIIMLLC